jgi:phosphatidylglycerophosphate synthase
MSFERGTGRTWLPGILYLAAAVLDGLDGTIARGTRFETQMGSELDTKMDAFGLLVAIGVAVRIGQLPLFYFPVAMAYYIFKAAAALRQRYGKPVVPLLPRPAARAIAGMTMGLVGVALLPVYTAPATTVAAGLFMLPFSYGFLRDWLVVCESVETDLHQQAGWEPHLKNFFTEWLPPVFRFMLLFTALGLFVQGIDLPVLSSRSDFAAGMSSAHLLIAVQTVLIVMVVAGCLGRTASLGLTLVLGWRLQWPGVEADRLAMFICAVCLMLSGTGLYSLWQPEDRFLYRKRSPVKSF